MPDEMTHLVVAGESYDISTADACMDAIGRVISRGYDDASVGKAARVIAAAYQSDAEEAGA